MNSSSVRLDLHTKRTIIEHTMQETFREANAALMDRFETLCTQIHKETYAPEIRRLKRLPLEIQQNWLRHINSVSVYVISGTEIDKRRGRHPRDLIYHATHGIWMGNYTLHVPLLHTFGACSGIRLKETVLAPVSQPNGRIFARVDAFNALVDEVFDELVKQYRMLETLVELIKPLKTLSQLKKAWPEGEPFYQYLEPKEKETCSQEEKLSEMNKLIVEATQPKQKRQRKKEASTP